MVICTRADTDQKRDFKMSTRPDEVMLGVRIPLELRRAVKRYVADRDTSVEALVNELLEATVAEGAGNAKEG
jgi:hypothetical protein